jgi:hypothetical protein
MSSQSARETHATHLVLSIDVSACLGKLGQDARRPEACSQVQSSAAVLRDDDDDE